MKSLIVAFSTYSKIPMPHIKWDEKSMRYSMCFFPFVGLVIGVFWILMLELLRYLELPIFFQTIILTVLPVFITGGIHIDGFMDTMDAMHSYKSREEKLEILKDPHIGAFSVIYVICYFLLMLGAIYLYLTKLTESGGSLLLQAGMLFVYERILSGLSVVLFPKAKKSGMLAMTAQASAKQVKVWLFIELIICVGLMIWMLPFTGVILAAAGGIIFLYYRFMAEKIFGGTTGDLAGYFLQLCELVLFLIIALIS